MSNEKQTAEDMIKSLTYFDELAIEQAFGSDWSNLAQNKPLALMRALSFVQKRRDGMNDHEAKQAVFGMSLEEVQNAWVSEEEDEVFVDPDADPSTEAGKGDAVSN